MNYSADNGATFAGKATAADASLQGPALCQINGNLLMAWTASANNQINLSKVNVAGNAVTGFSGKVSLVDTTPYSPALAALNNVLFLAWTSAGSGALNIALSLDNGASFVSKYVSAQSSAAAPALTVQNGALLVAWKGNGNDALNVGQVLLSGNTITGIGNVVKLADASDHSPALASNGTLFLAWKGSGNPELNVESSTDGGRTFINKFTVPTASDSATWADALDNGLVHLRSGFRQRRESSARRHRCGGRRRNRTGSICDVPSDRKPGHQLPDVLGERRHGGHGDQPGTGRWPAGGRLLLQR